MTVHTSVACMIGDMFSPPAPPLEFRDDRRLEFRDDRRLVDLSSRWEVGIFLLDLAMLVFVGVASIFIDNCRSCSEGASGWASRETSIDEGGALVRDRRLRRKGDDDEKEGDDEVDDLRSVSIALTASTHV